MGWERTVRLSSGIYFILWAGLFHHRFSVTRMELEVAVAMGKVAALELGFFSGTLN
jgi:hypothetical protein